MFDSVPSEVIPVAISLASVLLIASSVKAAYHDETIDSLEENSPEDEHPASGSCSCMSSAPESTVRADPSHRGLMPTRDRSAAEVLCVGTEEPVRLPSRQRSARFIRGTPSATPGHQRGAGERAAVGERVHQHRCEDAA